MAHPYRILHVRRGRAGRAGGLAVSRRGQHLATAAANASGQRPDQPRTSLSHKTIRDLPLVATPGHHHHGHPGHQRFGHHAVPPPQIIRSACDSSSSCRPSPTTAHGGTRDRRGRLWRDTTTRDRRAALPRRSVSSATSAMPPAPVVAVDGATTTTGPSPGGISSTTTVGSKCRGPTITASSGQSGRGTSSAGSVAISLPAGPGSVAGKPIVARAAAALAESCVPRPCGIARSTASRSLPRTPTPGASPLPIGGSPFDGRYSGAGSVRPRGCPAVRRPTRRMR